jgi:hypothetical protein
MVTLVAVIDEVPGDTVRSAETAQLDLQLRAISGL